MKRLPLPQAFITIICVAILCSLGTWQIQRLAWKNAMIERLESDYASGRAGTIMPLSQLAAMDLEKEPVAYGGLQGRLLIEKAILVGPKVSDGRSGYDLVLPLMLENDKAIIVNAGWVSDLWKDDTNDRLAAFPRDIVTIRGVIRKPDYNRFSSRNSPENDLWFTAYPAEIAKAKGLKDVYGLMLYAETTVPPLHDVVSNEGHWLPRNKHLEYAIFWYSMAIVMIAVFAVYAAGRMKAAKTQRAPE